MAINFATYSGKSNTGFHQKTNEDYILFNEKDFGDDILFAAIADGSGSKESMFRPASIACHQTETMLKRIYKKNEDLFLKHTKLFMEEAFMSANNILIGFKLGDEEQRGGFASTLTCALIEKRGILTFAHAGNSRLYLVRDGNVYQLTTDHTDAQKLVDSGTITKENYYTAIERLSLYNGLGISPEPIVQTVRTKLQVNDVIIMTTDGIHYSYPSEAFFEILMGTESIDAAAEEMIEAALRLKNFPDNLSVNIIWYHGGDEDEG